MSHQQYITNYKDLTPTQYAVEKTFTLFPVFFLIFILLIKTISDVMLPWPPGSGLFWIRIQEVKKYRIRIHIPQYGFLIPLWRVRISWKHRPTEQLGQWNLKNKNNILYEIFIYLKNLLYHLENPQLICVPNSTKRSALQITII